ncbi:ROK family protein [Bacillus sp. FJAT-26390]|uniref:ROK family protein n=1 Tax=Bacillus sp. FJAT-26390 TaxID=1743142 RepID=UPI0009E32DAA|nr:ROK family protein [Bacillus sp. FJAT-26390]
MNRHSLASILAVDLGGTSIVLGEMAPDGEMVRSKSYPSDTTTQSIAIESIIQAIDDYKRTFPFKPGELAAIGIGLVGRVDEERGIWLEIEPGKSEPTDVKEIIEQHYGVPCGIDNDVACATKAEQELGWGTVSDNFIYLNIGTGIAAGLVADGNYVNGSNFNSGEIGHMVVAQDSDVECGCGRKGCVERIASGLGMHERIMALKEQYPATTLSFRDNERVSASEIFEGAALGDELSLKVSEEAARALASLIMNLVRVSDPDTIVLGGGIARNEYFLGRIKSYLNPRTMRFVAHSLVPTKQPTAEVGLVGAALAGLKARKRYEEELANHG